MSENAPDFLWITHDDYHAKYIGSTIDNRQFFLTTPFVPARGDNPGCEFVAVYFFDTNGKFLEAKIDNLGVRQQRHGAPPGNQQVDPVAARALIETRLAELGEVTFGDIKVAPFRLEKFGVEFGLIPRPPEEAGDDCWVEIQPGNYMAFSPPWDGDYDT